MGVTRSGLAQVETFALREQSPGQGVYVSVMVGWLGINSKRANRADGREGHGGSGGDTQGLRILSRLRPWARRLRRVPRLIPVQPPQECSALYEGGSGSRCLKAAGAVVFSSV